MADEPIPIRDANRTEVSVLADLVEARNGTPVIGTDRAQIVLMARGSAGAVNDIGPDSPLEVQDNSPPFVQLAKGGMDLTAGDVTPIVDANVAREFVDIMCLQDDAATPRAYLWLEVGDGVPEVGIGDFLRPDTIFSQFSKAAVSVLATEDCRVTWVEWGKG